MVRRAEAIAEMKKIKIVGGGLAGLSLAHRLVSDGLDVEVHEKRSYPMHRVCGEFISGVSDEVLANLGVRDCLVGAQRVDSVNWFIGSKKVFSQVLGEPAYGISRYLLDKRLSDGLLERGGVLHTGSLYRGDAEEGVVWATGKNMRKGGKWIGLSMHLVDHDMDCLEMHSAASGYIGLSPVEDRRVNVTGLFQSDVSVRGKGVELMIAYVRHCGLGDLADRLASVEKDSASFCAISGFDFGVSATKEKLFLGDSGHFIPPFVGNGMSMAMESAWLATDPVRSYSRGEMGWEACCEMVHHEMKMKFGTRMAMSMVIHPFIFTKFGLWTVKSLGGVGLLPVGKLYQLTR